MIGRKQECKIFPPRQYARKSKFLLETLKINFYILIYAETHPICTLRTLRNPLRTLRLNPNHVNRKVRKDRAKDAKNLFLEVPFY